MSQFSYDHSYSPLDCLFKLFFKGKGSPEPDGGGGEGGKGKTPEPPRSDNNFYDNLPFQGLKNPPKKVVVDACSIFVREYLYSRTLFPPIIPHILRKSITYSAQYLPH